LSHGLAPEQGVAMCEEALHVLAGLGALELSDLSAAAAWADVADSEAREALDLGRLDDAERLEKQVGSVATGVLAKRPGELRAMVDLFYSPNMLSTIEEKRFHDTTALKLAIQARQAAGDYVRFNPSDTTGWFSLLSADFAIVDLLARLGRISEALEVARNSMQLVGDHNNLPLPPAIVWGQIATLEAQRGNRGSADQAVQEARRSVDAFISVSQLSKVDADYWVEEVNALERTVRLNFGENEAAHTLAKQALPRVEQSLSVLTNPTMKSLVLWHRQMTLEQCAQSALKLKQYADAESAGRALASSVHTSYSSDDDLSWGRVLQAQALVGLGRPAEALPVLEPALAKYREMQAQGAADVQFCLHYARALYVQALAQPAAGEGVARSRAALDQANALLQGLTEEARQLHDAKELLPTIAAAMPPASNAGVGIKP